MDVEVLRWPSERTRRAALRKANRPRLLIVDTAGPLPTCTDPLEDWAATSADSRELDNRQQTLRLRAEGKLGEPIGAPPPVLDDEGILRAGSSWVALPALEERLMRALLAEPGAIVSRQDLMTAGWPEGISQRNSLDVRIMRLRRRIGPLGVTLRTIRGRGYAVES